MSHLYIKTIFCQDRLRTNIGKTQNRTVFLQGFPGLLDNEELDAKTMAGFGIDFFKV
eukprot:COSAG06_NODE_6512_length_2900_cov_2.361657_4_plen_57_part_00